MLCFKLAAAQAAQKNIPRYTYGNEKLAAAQAAQKCKLSAIRDLF